MKSIWLRAAFGAALLLSTTSFANAQSNGRLLFLNTTTGDCLLGGVDVGGYLHTPDNMIEDNTCPVSGLAGMTDLVPTSAGILAYQPSGGSGTVLLLDSLDFLYGHTKTLSAGWTNIVAFGNYLLFYKSPNIGAVLYVTSNGGTQQTQSISDFSRWSQITATDNYLFFYEESTGAFAVGTIIADAGTFYETDSGSGIATGYTVIASLGDDLLLYNPATGAYEIGSIYFTAGLKDFFDKRSSGKLAEGYHQAIRSGGYLLLYDGAVGTAAIGYISQAGTWVQTQKMTLPRWTSIVAAGTHILFYNSVSGNVQISYIAPNGTLANTSSQTIGTKFNRVVATRQ